MTKKLKSVMIPFARTAQVFNSLIILEEFVTYLKYCRDLEFESKPDYTYLKQLFKELFVKNGYESDYVFDWALIKYVISMD